MLSTSNYGLTYKNRYSIWLIADATTANTILVEHHHRQHSLRCLSFDGIVCDFYTLIYCLFIANRRFYYLLIMPEMGEIGSWRFTSNLLFNIRVQVCKFGKWTEPLRRGEGRGQVSNIGRMWYWRKPTIRAAVVVCLHVVRRAELCILSVF